MAFIEPMHRNKPNITYLLGQYILLRASSPQMAISPNGQLIEKFLAQTAYVSWLHLHDLLKSHICWGTSPASIRCPGFDILSTCESCMPPGLGASTFMTDEIMVTSDL